MTETFGTILGYLLGIILVIGFLAPVLVGAAVGIALGGWHIPLWIGIGVLAMAMVSRN